MVDLQVWQQRLAVFDQTALEAIANKGLLRRAKKDLQQGTVPKVVAIASDQLQLQIEEATVTLPEQGPTQAACTCPAVETCRHILLACLWLGTLSDAIETEKSTQTAERASEGTLAPTIDSPDTPDSGTAAANSLEQLSAELRAYTIAQLTRWAGKKTVQTAMEHLASGQESRITEAVPISVQFPQTNITCRFFPKSGLEGAICSCKARQVCAHTVAAVLAYQKAHGVGINALEQSPAFLQEAKGAPRSRAEVIAAVKTLLEECVTLGLCHLSDSMRQRFATLSVSALGVNLPRLSRLLRSLSDEVQLNLDRDARADQNRLFLLAARTYALCAALENLGQTGEAPGSPTSPQALIGWHRSQYEAVGTLELVGLAAYHWHTASGYAGLTVLFWHEAGQQWYSWSEARPIAPGTRFAPTARYWQAELWMGLPNPARASQSRFQLTAARKNRQNRLSSSTRCRATLIGPTDPATIDWGDRCFRDWQALRTYAATGVTAGLGEPEPLQAIVVLCPTAWGARQFDDIQQVLIWPVLDSAGQELLLRVLFRPVDQQRIETLEALDVEQTGVWGIVAQLNVSRSGLSLYPISLLCHTVPNIINLSFSRDSAAQTNAASGSEKTQTSPVPDRSETSKALEGEFSDRDEPSDLAESDPTESDLADENSPTDLDPWATLSPLEQRLTQLGNELQRWADRGSNVLTPASRQPFASEANLFDSVGMEVFSASLRTLANSAENSAAALLKLRYLCQLSQEVAVKARCQSN